MPSQRPDLGLEEIPDRIDRRRVVGMPGEVAEETLGLVAGAERNPAERSGQIEQCDHPHPGHDVAEPAGRGRIELSDQTIHTLADIDGTRRQAEGIDHQLRIAQAGRARGPVRHPNRRHVGRPERTSSQIRHHRAVDPAGKAENHPFETATAGDLIFEELHQPALGQLRVDLERVLPGRRRNSTCAPGKNRSVPSGRVAACNDLPPGRERIEQMGQMRFQIRQHRLFRPDTRHLIEVYRDDGQAVLEDRSAGHDAAARIHHERASGKRLAPFEAHQVRNHDEQPVLRSDRLRHPFPSHRAGRTPVSVFAGLYPTRRAGREHHHELGAIQGCHGRDDRMPGVLAHNHRHSAPGQVERLHRSPRLNEAFFIEHAVGRQENLAMDMADPCAASSETGRQRGVVEAGVPEFVESDDDIERRRTACRVRFGQVGIELLGRHREFPNAPFDEVPRQRRFGQNEEIDRFGIPSQVSKELTRLLEVGPIGSFAGSELGDGEPKHAER